MTAWGLPGGRLTPSERGRINSTPRLLGQIYPTNSLVGPNSFGQFPRGPQFTQPIPSWGRIHSANSLVGLNLPNQFPRGAEFIRPIPSWASIYPTNSLVGPNSFGRFLHGAQFTRPLPSWGRIHSANSFPGLHGPTFSCGRRHQDSRCSFSPHRDPGACRTGAP